MPNSKTRTTRTPAFWYIPRRPMITHTSDSHQIPSQNKSKSKLQTLKKLPKIEILQKTLQATHLPKLLAKMYPYEMDLTRTVGATERICDAGRTRDGRTDGRTDGVIPPNNFVGGYNEEKASNFFHSRGNILLIQSSTWRRGFKIVYANLTKKIQ